MITNRKIALDTNVLIYLYDSFNIEKRHISESLLVARPLICSQVISEFLNVTKRLQKLTKAEILAKCASVLIYCEITNVGHSTLNLALSLIKQYDFQLFDSIIVASALESDCEFLYSEDFQHNQVIENHLTILNPYLLNPEHPRITPF